MGCASSKRTRCRHCGRKPSPLSRCNSVPVHLPVPVHHPAKHNGDSYHIVALTSSTLGTLKLDSPLQNEHHGHGRFSTNVGSPLHDEEEENDKEGHKEYDQKQRNNSNSKSKEEFSREIRLAKTWSDMINQKIPMVTPKTPVRTPPGEPETINAWELMEDLEDTSPFRLPNLADPHRCFSFHAVLDSSPSNPSNPKLVQENGYETPLPQWLQMSNGDPDQNSKPIVSDFDPEIISTFRKALEEISPTNTSLLRSPDPEKIATPINHHWSSILSSKTEAADTKKASSGFMMTNGSECPPGGEDKVVVYFTSLRGVRKTYENCCQVRVILKGLGVRLDERDVSMDYGFREELKELVGDDLRRGLPRVFVMGRYIGGVDEIKQLHEDGGLEKLVQGCRKLDDDGGDDGGGGCGVCEACGDIRFVPCDRCSGSCKIYYEGGEEEEEEEEYGFMRCPDCNENGIVRCPICC